MPSDWLIEYLLEAVPDLVFSAKVVEAVANILHSYPRWSKLLLTADTPNHVIS
jgi:hypothetical protein